MTLIRRIRAAWKLNRGRCTYCRAVLRDDATTRQCSDACERQEELFVSAW